MKHTIINPTIYILFIGLFLLSAYSYAQGKNSLEGKIVTSFDLKFDESQAAKPGSSIQIGVSAKLEDGTIMNTKGWLDGKMKWTDFTVDVVGGTQGGALVSGSVVVSNISSETKDHVVSVKVTSNFDAKLTASISIPIDYNVALTGNFNGRTGEMGQAGQKGDNGTDDGSMYDNRSKGDKGKPGRDGGPGGAGQTGSDADNIKIYVTTTTHKISGDILVQVVVTDVNGGNPKYYIFNPKGGSLNISADGGQGGQGGTGGTGGSGGKGMWVKSDERKQEGGDGGDGGNGGMGGAGGDGGAGGSITIYCDPSAQEFLSKIVTSNDGGAGGNAGSAGSGGNGGSGGTGYLSGKNGSAGKSGYTNSQSGRAGAAGPSVSIITQAVDLRQFGIE